MPYMAGAALQIKIFDFDEIVILAYRLYGHQQSGICP